MQPYTPLSHVLPAYTATFWSAKTDSTTEGADTSSTSACRIAWNVASREPRLFTLSHEASVRARDEPLAIVLEAHRGDARALQRDAATAFDWIDVEGGDACHGRC